MKILLSFLLSVCTMLSLEAQSLGSMVTASGGEIRHNGKQIGSGTLLYHQNNIFLVTAKHVIEKQFEDKLTYRFFDTGKQNDFGSTIEINLERSDTNEFLFFSDSYDLALIHIGFSLPQKGQDKEQIHLYDIAKYSNYTKPVQSFTTNRIWLYDDLVLGIDIYTLGFPSELERSNDTRISMVKGIVSGFYSDGRIKCQLPVYGGNSGGPVFVYSNSSPEEYGGKNIIIGSKSAYLIGVITDFVAYTDSAISQRGSGLVLTTNSGFSKVEPIGRVIDMIQDILSK